VNVCEEVWSGSSLLDITLASALCGVTCGMLTTCADANSSLLCQPAACVWARGRAGSWSGWWRPLFPFWHAAEASPPSRTAATLVSYTTHTHT